MPMFFNTTVVLSLLFNNTLKNYSHRVTSKTVNLRVDSLVLTLDTFISSVTQTSYVIFPQDGNGYIDEQELDALLKDLCDKNKMVMSLLIDQFRLLSYLPNIETIAA